MKRYTFQCTQADGSLFQYLGTPMPLKDARAMLKEYKSVFTPCKNWQVVEVK